MTYKVLGLIWGMIINWPEFGGPKVHSFPWQQLEGGHGSVFALGCCALGPGARDDAVV